MQRMSMRIPAMRSGVAVVAMTVALTVASPLAAAPREAPGPLYADRDDAMQLADAIATRRQLDPQWVREQLGRARFVAAVPRLIMPPPAGTAKNWAAYRARFIEPTRIRAGMDWWAANAATLQAAEDRYGVPPEIVVAIVGVETLYGRHMGNFRVLDALATLSLDFPSGRRDRSGFFRDELEAFMAWTHREGLDPGAPKGSFAGAIGLPQFMPSSILKYGVDFNGNGRVDLQGSAADVIGSVAHYLAEFGWQRGLPTVHGVQAPVDTADRAALLAPDILPTFTPAQLAERGAQLAASAQDASGLLALVELQNGDAAPSYVAGTTNFYAITRYNWSSYYAMAVIDLAAELKARRLVAQKRGTAAANRP
jgi:membrane-bound lytic murein transglycosylase B